MNQITTTKGGFNLAPQSLAEAMEFATTLAKSSIVPKDYQGNPGNVIVAIQWGAEIGLAPLQAMQSIAVINGRPAIWGDAMIALVKGSGLLESMNEDVVADAATCTVKRKGEAAVSRTFCMEDAKRAGLTGKAGPWTQYPKRMLQMRARAWALRDVFPDVLRGVHVGEEAQDLPAEAKDMGLVDEVKPAQPASRAERTRAAIAQRKAPPAALTAPTIDVVLGAIHSAASPDTLKAAAEMATALTNDDDKAIAREAYTTRLHSLKAVTSPTPAVDQETGEIFPPNDVPGADNPNADFLAGLE